MEIFQKVCVFKLWVVGLHLKAEGCKLREPKLGSYSRSMDHQKETGTELVSRHLYGAICEDTRRVENVPGC